MSRKETILGAATALFAQKGFSATPTSAIAREAGVAEGLVFHYFKTKEGILLCILEDVAERYISGCRARFENCPTGLEAVKALIGFHFQFSAENSDALVVLIRDQPFSAGPADQESFQVMKYGVESTISLWEECINKGKRDGTIKDVPARQTALILQAMLNGVSRLQILGPLEVPDLTSHIIEFCVRAISKIG
jgi:AcrR family transcriptional regulator